jgi:uncharacterized damage-inducible protein DinB
MEEPMATTVLAPEIALVLDLIDQAYDKKAWHGPNLRGAIRRLHADQASWRPAPGRKSIAEIVVHCAYWKYAVRRRLQGDKRGSFPLKGSNWFVLPERLSESEWKTIVHLLDDQHETLRSGVAALPPKRLRYKPANSKYRHSDQILGIAAHDVYHTGQIQTLKRLQGAEEE